MARFYQYEIRGETAVPVRIFLSEAEFLCFCKQNENMIRDNLAMNGNDRLTWPKTVSFCAETGAVRYSTERTSVPRTIMFTDSDFRIIDPRPVVRAMTDAEYHRLWISIPKKNDWKKYRIKTNHKPHRSSEFRPVRYRHTLRDPYFERQETEGYHVRPPREEIDAWAEEPWARVSGSWKDQSRRQHQYREKNALPYIPKQEELEDEHDRCNE